MNTGPSPPHPFRVLIGFGTEPIIGDVFADIIRGLLPEGHLDIRFTNSQDVHVIARLPEARSADFLLFHVGNLLARIPDDEPHNGSPAWHSRRVRILRNTCPGAMVCMTGRFKEGTGEAMRAAGADLGLPAPCEIAEIRELILKTYQRWLETRTTGDPTPLKPLVTDHSSLPAQPQSLPPRSRTILVSDDEFAKILEAVLAERLAGMCEFRFVRFRSEYELRKLAATCAADLIYLYIGNIVWTPRPPSPEPAVSPNRRRDLVTMGIEVLGEISRAYGVPVIAIQSTDRRAEATRAGIHFLEAPFKLAEFLPVVHAALGIPPAATDPPA